MVEPYYFPIGLTHFLCLCFPRKSSYIDLFHYFQCWNHHCLSLLPSFKGDIDVVSGLLPLLTTLLQTFLVMPALKIIQVWYFCI